MSRTEIARLGTPEVETPPGPPPKRLVVKDLRKGWGPSAKVSDELAVDFVGAPYGSKRPHWKSQGGLEPFVFHLGAYDVVPGWERGLQGMRVGGRRGVIVPAKLTGAGGARVYVVDLLAVQRGQPPAFGASDGPQEPGKPAVEASTARLPSKLAVEDLRQGSGTGVQLPAEVVVKLYGANYETGESFLNSWGPDRTADLTLRNPQNIWARGLGGMKVGGRRELIVPAKLAFGGPPLVYIAELVSIE